jgi:hypothetical protein
VVDIDFKVISTTENSNKFQKTRFWKEKSLEDIVTLGPMAQATLAVFESKDVHAINCICVPILSWSFHIT